MNRRDRGAPHTLQDQQAMVLSRCIGFYGHANIENIMEPSNASADHPSNGTVRDIMPVPSNSLSAEPEDPWDWSVEQAIDAVCHDKESPLAERNIPDLVLHNPETFEHKLRENSVRGLTFLKELDDDSLKNDLDMLQ